MVEGHLVLLGDKKFRVIVVLRDTIILKSISEGYIYYFDLIHHNISAIKQLKWYTRRKQ